MNNNNFDQRLLPITMQDINGKLPRYLQFNTTTFRETFPRFSIFSGEPGTGKTTIARGIAAKYNYAEQIVECSQLNLSLATKIFSNLAIQEAPHLLILHNLDLSTVPLWPLIDQIDYTNHKIIGTCQSESNLPIQLIERTYNFVEVPLPSFKTRKCIARYYIEKNGFQRNEGALEIIAQNTNSFSGKELKSLVERMVKSANKKLADPSIKNKIMPTDDIINALENCEHKSRFNFFLSYCYQVVKNELIDKWPQLITLVPLIYKIYTTHRLLKSYAD